MSGCTFELRVGDRRATSATLDTSHFLAAPSTRRRGARSRASTRSVTAAIEAACQPSRHRAEQRLRDADRRAPTRTAPIIRASRSSTAGVLVDPPEVPERARSHPRRARRRRARRAGRARGRSGSTRSAACTRPSTSSSSSTRTNGGATATGLGEDSEAIAYAARDPRAALRRTAANVIAQLGWYSHDSDPVLAGTWPAAVGAVDVHDHRVASRRRRATNASRTRWRARPAITRRPTRSRATATSNNAAIAAQAWVDRGARVAIVDVDYHHGNGTQQIFYDRDDVLFVSLHADPADEYPFFLGFAAEQGWGARRGLHPQLPAPRGHRAGTRTRPRSTAALAVVRKFAPDGVDRLARRRHRARRSRHVPARRRRLHAHRRRARRARPPDASSCKRAATASTSSAATSRARAARARGDAHAVVIRRAIRCGA